MINCIQCWLSTKSKIDLVEMNYRNEHVTHNQCSILHSIYISNFVQSKIQRNFHLNRTSFLVRCKATKTNYFKGPHFNLKMNCRTTYLLSYTLPQNAKAAAAESKSSENVNKFFGEVNNCEWTETFPKLNPKFFAIHIASRWVNLVWSIYAILPHKCPIYTLEVDTHSFGVDN